MKTMYVLQGKSKSGKTTTLKKVRELIKEDERFESETHPKVHQKDITVVLTLKDGTKIGINSAGDNEQCVEGIGELTECDIIFCACSPSYGAAVKYIDRFRNEYATFYIHKKSAELGEEQNENEKMAQHLIKCAFTLV